MLVCVVSVANFAKPLQPSLNEIQLVPLILTSTGGLFLQFIVTFSVLGAVNNQAFEYSNLV